MQAPRIGLETSGSGSQGKRRYYNCPKRVQIRKQMSMRKPFPSIKPPAFGEDGNIRHHRSYRRKRPKDGKKDLNEQAVLLGITWKPTRIGVFKRFHISDVWLDNLPGTRATQIRTKPTRLSSRADGCQAGWTRWNTASSDGPRSPSLIWRNEPIPVCGFQKRAKCHACLIGKHPEALGRGDCRHTRMASKGILLEVSKTKRVPLGSSGIQLSLETNLVTEGLNRKNNKNPSRKLADT